MDESASGECSRTVIFTRQNLYDILKNSEQTDFENKFLHLQRHVGCITQCPDEYNKELIHKLSHFKSQFKAKWADSNRKEDRFIKNNCDWLKGTISFPSFKTKSEHRSGRPKISFEDCSERTKRLRTTELRNVASASELSYAAQMSLRASGLPEAAKVVKEVCESPHDRATEYIKGLQLAKVSDPVRLLSDVDALALFVDAELTRHQYELIRASDPGRFPSYKKLQACKKLCYPSIEHIEITETSVKVKLQELLNHTIDRILSVQQPVAETLTESELKHLHLSSKWGFDGSSGHSSYKQAFHDKEASDSAVFITSFLPIRLETKDNNDSQKIIWQNPRPSSTRYCRPLKIEYVKESNEVALSEKTRIDREIENLEKSVIRFGNVDAEVQHQLIFSMVDGKICNALADNSSTQRCYICGSTSKEFNQIDVMLNRPINQENLQFGLSILHGWIRLFENLLHLSYKIPIQKWQTREPDLKKIVEANKKRIQKEFRDKCGLLVDIPKPGFGNSNDGNTARRFFSNPEISSEITHIDVDLIKRLHTILLAVTSGHEINTRSFKEFALSTAWYYVDKYPWYYMSPTLHKFLIHGPQLIESALLPIGQLSEEAQEARNKDFKKYREHHSRKCSREKSNRDIFIGLMLSSDPLLSSKRKLPKKKFQRLPTEVINLLMPPSTASYSNKSSSSEEEDS